MQYVYKVIWEVRLEGGVLKKKTQVKTLDVANSFTDLIRWMEPLTVIKTGGEKMLPAPQHFLIMAPDPCLLTSGELLN